MECPSCRADVADAAAAFCSRCGSPLGAPQGETTDRLDASAVDPPAADAAPAVDEAPVGDTHRIPAGETSGAGDPVAAAGRTANVAGDMVRALRAALASGGWLHAAEAAAVAFLGLLAIGAAFVLLAKLLNPGFGAGQNPLWMLTRIILAGQWSIGVTIEREAAGSSVLPLGALFVFAWVLVQAARRVEERSGAVSLRERALDGLKIGIPFALMCFLAAVVFRIRSGRAEIGADPVLALVVPLLWGSLFGALGALRSAASFRDLVRRAGEAVDRVRPGVADGLWAGALMLGATAVMALGAVLLFIVVGLAGARSVPLSFGDAIVFVAALAAFLPNVVVGASAFALGGPIHFLARTIDDVSVERRASLILGGEGARGYAYLLLGIPAAACLLGGYAVRRRSTDPAAAAVVLGTAAVTYALVLCVLVALSSMRVGQAFLGDGNYLVAAADPAATLLLGALWAAGFGYAGWRVADEQKAP